MSYLYTCSEKSFAKHNTIVIIYKSETVGMLYPNSI